MKKNSILLIILAICLSITSNACFCSSGSGGNPPEEKPKEKPDFTYKLKLVTPEKIQHTHFVVARPCGFFEFKLLCEGPDWSKGDDDKITFKVSTINNENPPNSIDIQKYNNDVTDYDGYGSVTNSTFTHRYTHRGSIIKLRLVDSRNNSAWDKQVEIKVELLYDGELLENPESKCSFFWKVI